MGGAHSTHEEIRNAYNILVEIFKGRDYLGDLGIDIREILKWILEEWSWYTYEIQLVHKRIQ